MSEVKTSPLLGTDANGDPTYTFTSAHTFGDVARWIASEGGAEDVAFMLSEAALTRANAATAAAYEVAARAIDADGEYVRSIGLSKRIHALATPDQTAALDKMIAEAVKPYVEALENIAQEASVPIHTWQNGINFKRMYEGWRKIATERIDTARAILAASKKGGV